MNDSATGRSLLRLARRAIERGLTTNSLPASADYAEIPEPESRRALRTKSACFVTLKIGGKLRGCMGNLENEQSLLRNVITNAYRAAFEDPRFSPLSAEELSKLEIHVSVLGPLEPLNFHDENELVALLRPGRDGLLIRMGSRQATFLPAVWEQIPEPDLFYQELKRKARLPARPLAAPDLEAFRYSTRSYPA